jgi:hypothetical protein
MSLDVRTTRIKVRQRIDSPYEDNRIYTYERDVLVVKTPSDFLNNELNLANKNYHNLNIHGEVNIGRFHFKISLHRDYFTAQRYDGITMDIQYADDEYIKGVMVNFYQGLLSNQGMTYFHAGYTIRITRGRISIQGLGKGDRLVFMNEKFREDCDLMEYRERINKAVDASKLDENIFRAVLNPIGPKNANFA